MVAKRVFANIAMPEADTNPDFKSWTGTDKITKKENGKQQNRITKTGNDVTVGPLHVTQADGTSG